MNVVFCVSPLPIGIGSNFTTNDTYCVGTANNGSWDSLLVFKGGNNIFLLFFSYLSYMFIVVGRRYDKYNARLRHQPNLQPPIRISLDLYELARGNIVKLAPIAASSACARVHMPLLARPCPPAPPLCRCCTL